jgi:hypothetical protein
MDSFEYQQSRDFLHDMVARDASAARIRIRTAQAEAFEKFDRRELAKMDDKALAVWQAMFDTDQPQWRLAEHEWQRRLTAEQIAATMRAARGQAWFGIAGLFIGALLTLLGALLSR